MSEEIPMNSMPADKDGSMEVEIEGEKFEMGQEIKVRRSNGTLENDWNFISMAPQGKVKVTKEVDGKVLTKYIEPKDFVEWQHLEE